MRNGWSKWITERQGRRPSKAAGTPAMDGLSRYTRGHLNDFTAALGQQMFFWGRDVMTEGNLLLEAGFEKRPSQGLQGTSCYRLAWGGGWVELHGACAGWFPQVNRATEAECGEGFLFIRADRRCYRHRLCEAVVPGRYDYAQLESRDWRQVLHCSRRFAAWLCEYERWIQQRMALEYRRGCWEMYAKLTASRPWLEVAVAQHWLQRFAAGDAKLERARIIKAKHQGLLG
jgi:hypothetical protein